MSEVKKIATRESYGNALVEIGKEHEDLVVLDADLAGATKTAIFQKVFPERHIDCGIAEGNMMGVAAGLAATGKVPFASSFAMFAAGRAFEQIRNSIGYPHLNVKIGCYTRRYFCRRRRCYTSVQRRYCPDAYDPGHGDHQPCR